jgi:ribosomal protein L37AE/L43A
MMSNIEMTDGITVEWHITCRACGDDVPDGRAALGIGTCMPCGERAARARKHTIVPMPKSNYIVVTDLELLKGLNSSHRGNR